MTTAPRKLGPLNLAHRHGLQNAPEGPESLPEPKRVKVSTAPPGRDSRASTCELEEQGCA